MLNEAVQESVRRMLDEMQEAAGVDLAREGVPGFRAIKPRVQRVRGVVHARHAEDGLHGDKPAQAALGHAAGGQLQRGTQYFRVPGARVDEHARGAEIARVCRGIPEKAAHTQGLHGLVQPGLAVLIGACQHTELARDLVGQGLHPGPHERVLGKVGARSVTDESRGALHGLTTGPQIALHIGAAAGRGAVIGQRAALRIHQIGGFRAQQRRGAVSVPQGQRIDPRGGQTAVQRARHGRGHRAFTGHVTAAGHRRSFFARPRRMGSMA